MSYRTMEVDLKNGRVTTRGSELLPAEARALLTILQSDKNQTAQSEAGLERFLTAPAFILTPEQIRTSMGVDFFEQ